MSIENARVQIEIVAADLKALRRFPDCSPLATVVAKRIANMEARLPLFAEEKGMIDAALAERNAAEARLNEAKRACVFTDDREEFKRRREDIEFYAQAYTSKAMAYQHAFAHSGNVRGSITAIVRNHTEDRDWGRAGPYSLKDWCLRGGGIGLSREMEYGPSRHTTAAAWEVFFTHLALETYEREARDREHPLPIGRLRDLLDARASTCAAQVAEFNAEHAARSAA